MLICICIYPPDVKLHQRINLSTKTTSHLRPALFQDELLDVTAVGERSHTVF